MSDHPPATNGNEDSGQVLDHVDLAARIEIVGRRATEALVESRATRATSDETNQLVRVMNGMLHKVINEHLELRTGIPTSWPRRLILAALCALVGGWVGAVVAGALLRR